MGKVEELIKLIEIDHSEWKGLSINGLRDASGYKRWVAEIVSKKYRSNPNQITSDISENKIIERLEHIAFDEEVLNKSPKTALEAIITLYNIENANIEINNKEKQNKHEFYR